MRTRHLIEHGGLITKAKLDYLPVNTLYGALLTLSESLQEDKNIIKHWTDKGANALNKEQQSKTAIIIKFASQPDLAVRKNIRTHGLKWNKFRGEWYGLVTDLSLLKQDLNKVTYELEVIEQN